jgi:hypothetical protein
VHLGPFLENVNEHGAPDALVRGFVIITETCAMMLHLEADEGVRRSTYELED